MSATLKSRIPLIAATMPARVGVALKMGAALVAEDAKARAPVGAPHVHLRDAIHVEQTGPAEYTVLAGDDQVFYGHFVEFGTSHSTPRPFMVPAAQAQSQRVLAGVRAVLGRL